MVKKPKSTNAVIAGIPRQAESTFDYLPDNGYLRELELVRSPRNTTAPLPFSAATLWRKVKNKEFPAPHRLGERTTAWRVSDVRAWMAAQGTQQPQAAPPHCAAVNRQRRSKKAGV